MNRNERYEMMITQFDQSANAFCDLTGGMSCEISSVFKKGNQPQMLKKRSAKIYYPSLTVLFQYTSHCPMGSIHSVLDCWLCFGKAETDVWIPLPFVADFCDADVLEPMCIPFISDDAGMEQAFSCIGQVVRDLMPKITAVSFDEEQKRGVINYYFEEYTAMTGNSDVYLATADYYKNFVTLRFASNAYMLAIKGKTEKAVKQLEKIKAKYRCEKRLIGLWKAGKNTDSSRIPAVVSNMDWLNDSGVEKLNPKILLSCLVTGIALLVPATAVYLGIYYLTTLIQMPNSFYLTGVSVNWAYVIFPGFITAMALSYFASFRFMRRFFKKDYEILSVKEHICGGGSEKVMRGFIRIVIVAGILFSVLISAYNLNFKDDGFLDNTKFFSVKGTYYGYDEIEYVKYIPNRVNAYGETLDRPSYVLIMKNGEEIDLYQYADIKNYEPILIPFLQEHGVQISDKSELPRQNR